ncbi:hypothetical protein AYI69_g8401 [Smittium culicis]|uniref:Uncharacterized protein n=1 Tax=Smittium culicis TaxID=133412 RepID=A0A1R1XJV4_9FUNG|nr:hypothetical protein AYI69_g8401 [Smittium culicis]
MKEVFVYTLDRSDRGSKVSSVTVHPKFGSVRKGNRDYAILRLSHSIYLDDTEYAKLETGKTSPSEQLCMTRKDYWVDYADDFDIKNPWFKKRSNIISLEAKQYKNVYKNVLNGRFGSNFGNKHTSAIFGRYTTNCNDVYDVIDKNRRNKNNLEVQSSLLNGIYNSKHINTYSSLLHGQKNSPEFNLQVMYDGSLVYHRYAKQLVISSVYSKRHELREIETINYGRKSGISTIDIGAKYNHISYVVDWIVKSTNLDLEYLAYNNNTKLSYYNNSGYVSYDDFVSHKNQVPVYSEKVTVNNFYNIKNPFEEELEIDRARNQI